MSDDIERSVASAGFQPVAWAVRWKGDTRIDRSTVCYTEDGARRKADECPALDGVAVALYRSPTLTEEERCGLELMRDLALAQGQGDDRCRMVRAACSILARLAVVAIVTLLATDRPLAMARDNMFPPPFEPPTEWQQKEEQRLNRDRWLQSQRTVVAPIMVTTFRDVEELRDEVRELRMELAELRAEMREMRKRK